jgi:hypothetical protein
MSEFLFRLNQFYRIDKFELRNLLVTMLAITLIWAFDDGKAEFVFSSWFGNFMSVLIICALTLIVHETAHKMAALRVGYMYEFKISYIGIIVGLVLAIISGGRLPFLPVGGINLYHMAKQRIGRFRYGLNFFTSGTIAFSGPLANIYFAMFMKTLQWSFGVQSPFLDKLFVFNLVFALYAMLPFPGHDGLLIFFGSKPTYVFIFGIVASYVLMIWIFNFYSLIWGLIFGIVCWFLWLRFVDFDE